MEMDNNPVQSLWVGQRITNLHQFIVIVIEALIHTSLTLFFHIILFVTRKCLFFVENLPYLTPQHWSRGDISIFFAV